MGAGMGANATDPLACIRTPLLLLLLLLRLLRLLLRLLPLVGPSIGGAVGPAIGRYHKAGVGVSNSCCCGAGMERCNATKQGRWRARSSHGSALISVAAPRSRGGPYSDTRCLAQASWSIGLGGRPRQRQRPPRGHRSHPAPAAIVVTVAAVTSPPLPLPLPCPLARPHRPTGHADWYWTRRTMVWAAPLPSQSTQPSKPPARTSTRPSQCARGRRSAIIWHLLSVSALRAGQSVQRLPGGKLRSMAALRADGYTGGKLDSRSKRSGGRSQRSEGPKHRGRREGAVVQNVNVATALGPLLGLRSEIVAPRHAPERKTRAVRGRAPALAGTGGVTTSTSPCTVISVTFVERSCRSGPKLNVTLAADRSLKNEPDSHTRVPPTLGPPCGKHVRTSDRSHMRITAEQRQHVREAAQL
jgi:hypothetical protein